MNYIATIFPFLVLLFVPFVSAEVVITDEGCYQGTDEEVTAACMLPENKNKGPCCAGTNACEWPNGITVTVCPHSCIGREACMFTNAFLVNPQAITIGQQSCRNFRACRDIGIYTEDDSPVNIGRGSCNGKEACHSMTGSVGQGSCNQSSACVAVIGNVGSLSCGDAPEACLFAQSVGDCVDHCEPGKSMPDACPE